MKSVELVISKWTRASVLKTRAGNSEGWVEIQGTRTWPATAGRTVLITLPPIHSGFLHVIIANLIRSFLYPSIIHGIASAPLMVLHPDQTTQETANKMVTQIRCKSTKSIRRKAGITTAQQRRNPLPRHCRAYDCWPERRNILRPVLGLYVLQYNKNQCTQMTIFFFTWKYMNAIIS